MFQCTLQSLTKAPLKLFFQSLSMINYFNLNLDISLLIHFILSPLPPPKKPKNQQQLAGILKVLYQGTVNDCIPGNPFLNK